MNTTNKTITFQRWAAVPAHERAPYPASSRAGSARASAPSRVAAARAPAHKNKGQPKRYVRFRKEKGHHPRVLAPVAALFLLIVCAVYIVEGSFLWLTSSAEQKNRLQAQPTAFSIQVVDEFTPPTTPPTPGEKISKTVGAINNGSRPGFVRMMVIPTILAQDGLTLLPAGMAQQVEADINTTEWMDGGDGYYYYLGKLEPGQSAPPLFTQVWLMDSLPQTYDGAKLSFEVKCEAVTTNPWAYRNSWWGSDEVPGNRPLLAIDEVLRQVVD